MTTATDTMKGTYLTEGQAQKEARSNEWFDQLSENLAGYLTKDIAGSGTVSLTNTIGGEAHHAVLVFTGVLSGSRTVEVPAATRTYLVHNNTSGAFPLTVQPVGGSGVAIPQGTWAILVCDGTTIDAPSMATQGTVRTESGLWRWTTSLSGSVASGQMGANQTDLTLVTELRLHEMSDENRDYLTAFQILVAGDQVLVQVNTDATIGARYELTGLGTDQGTYWTFPVAYVSGAATTPTNNAVMYSKFIQATPLPVASETVAGVVELATAAETTTGTDTTRAVTPAGLAAKVPSGPALSVARYAASGTALEAAPGIGSTANAGQLTLGEASLSSPTTGHLLVVERNAGVGIRVAMGGVAGGTNSASLILGGARTSLQAPTALAANDPLGHMSFMGYQGSAWSANVAILQAYAEETWSPTTLGCSLRISTTLVGASSRGERLRIDGQGNLTTWGGLCGLGTPLTATLGSGASYQALSVKGSLLAVLQSSVQERAAFGLTASWATSTDATRTGRLTVSAYDATAAREGLRVEADGTAARLSFYGASAVAKPTVTGAKGGNAALGSLLSALSSLGLVTDSSTA